MLSKLADINAVEAALQPVCAAHGVELVQVLHQREPDGAVLRVLIERPDAESQPDGVGGVTLDDCTTVSRALSSLIDEQPELVPGSFRLEVSSPGVERPLVRPSDYQRFAGREIRIKLLAPLNNRRKFEGTLLGLDEQRVKLDAGDEQIMIPLGDISKANLVYRF